MPSILSIPPTRFRRLLKALTGVFVLAVAIAITALTASTPPAGAETPAERCARETAAYNHTWKQAWVATHPGTTISDAPAPTPPYVCQDPATQTPTTTTQPSVTAPSMPTTTTPGAGGGPNMNAHGATDIPTPGTTPIVPVPSTTPSPSRLLASLPTSDGRSIILYTPANLTSTTVQEQRSADLSTITLRRETATAPSRFVFPTNLPSGTRWQELDGSRIALISGTGQWLSVLATSFQSRNAIALSHSGNDLVASFRATGVAPTVGEILSSLKHPASSNGCTTAPGPSGYDHECVNISGSGTNVTSAASTYYLTSPVGQAICNRQHQFLYTEASGRVVTKTVTPSSCVNPAAGLITGDYAMLPGTPLNLKDGSSFCTRAKNSATGGEWTPWACETVHA